MAYLGETRDYVIETADGHTLRASTPPGVIHEVGESVEVHMPISACRELLE
jgi:hypothetical protein